MSYTPQREEIKEEGEALCEAIQKFQEKLNNRVLSHSQWTKEHRDKCKKLHAALYEVYDQTKELI